METTSIPSSFSLQNFKLFIFDLDGTLYDQRKLRFRILIQLLIRFLCFKMSLKEFRIISSFRKQRENHKGYNSITLENDQFIWSSRELGIPVNKVQATIEKFMYKLPLKYIKDALYPDVVEFIEILKTRGYNIAIYSDYTVDEKIEALGLTADKTFCSTDDTIHCLKPDKKALLTICNYFDCETKDAIYFGDREDTDGESANRAGIKFIKIDIAKARKGKYFKVLMKQI
jgi:FMN phosphatase YigB (HAD superfamily)